MKKIYRKQAFRNRYRTLTYSAKSPTFIRDIRIVPHPEQDDYLVKIMYRDSLIEIPVYLQERSPLPDRVVKNNANFVKRYVSRLKRRERDWVRTNVDYDRALDEWREGYEALAEAARTGIIDVRQGMTFTRPLQQQGFAIFPFGTHNVDQFISFPATDSKMLAYSLKGEGKVKPRRVYLIDYTNQSVAFYRPNRKLVYSKYSSYALVALLDGNKVGYLRQEDFDRQVRSFGRKVELSAMDVGDISPQNLSKIFSS